MAIETLYGCISEISMPCFKVSAAQIGLMLHDISYKIKFEYGLANKTAQDSNCCQLLSKPQINTVLSPFCFLQQNVQPTKTEINSYTYLASVGHVCGLGCQSL